MNFSNFGQKFTDESSGVVQLMEDLGSIFTSERRMLMLGGGNPSHIPAVQTIFRQRMVQLLDNDDELERMLSSYSAPQGDTSFVKALAKLFNHEFGWNLSERNIALTQGSQTAFFYLFNLFAGDYANGHSKKILLPLTPEYIGYEDVGVQDDIFISKRPEFEFIDDHTFKYHVNFSDISITDEIGAICVSRPTNPTGNVLTDDEIDKLSQLAKAHTIPLIIDNAYGTPFPNIIFSEAKPIWDEHIILCMSLSKLGLPSVRTGIIIANEQVIQAISRLNAIISLAPANFGATLALEMVQNRDIIDLSRNSIRPYYQQRANQAVAWFHEALAGTTYYLHKPEGAFFLWLWFKDIPISSAELYQRLKARGVIVVPGHYFFPGLTEDWTHKHECLRMNYAQAENIVHEGINIIAEEVKRAYGE